MMQLSNNDIDRKLRLSKKFFCFGLVTFCIGFLMLGFAIGRLSSSSSTAEADGFQTEVTAGGNVYVSDSPGSKRYHKDRNCPALKRTTGKIQEQMNQMPSTKEKLCVDGVEKKNNS
jgi:hypothetical protein